MNSSDVYWRYEFHFEIRIEVRICLNSSECFYWSISLWSSLGFILGIYSTHMHICANWRIYPRETRGGYETSGGGETAKMSSLFEHSCCCINWIIVFIPISEIVLLRKLSTATAFASGWLRTFMWLNAVHDKIHVAFLETR